MQIRALRTRCQTSSPQWNRDFTQQRRRNHKRPTDILCITNIGTTPNTTVYTVPLKPSIFTSSSWTEKHRWQHAQKKLLAKHITERVSHHERLQQLCKNGTSQKNRHVLLLYSASLPLQFVTMSVLLPLLETAKENQFIIVATDGCTKTIKTFSSARIKTTDVGCILLQEWIIEHKVTTNIITNTTLLVTRSTCSSICIEVDTTI